MRQHIPLLLSFIASSAVAFVLPRDEPLVNGVYMFSYDARGKQVYKRLETTDNVPTQFLTSAEDAVMLHNITARAEDPDLHCGCGFDMTRSNCDLAVQSIKQMEAHGVALKGGSAIAAVFNDVVAFICNRISNAGFTVPVGSFEERRAQITNACGLYIAGTWGQQPGIAIGYMRWQRGANFCDDALGAAAHSCPH